MFLRQADFFCNAHPVVFIRLGLVSKLVQGGGEVALINRALPRQMPKKGAKRENGCLVDVQNGALGGEFAVVFFLVLLHPEAEIV